MNPDQPPSPATAKQEWPKWYRHRSGALIRFDAKDGYGIYEEHTNPSRVGAASILDLAHVTTWKGLWTECDPPAQPSSPAPPGVDIKDFQWFADGVIGRGPAFIVLNHPTGAQVTCRADKADEIQRALNREDLISRLRTQVELGEKAAKVLGYEVYAWRRESQRLGDNLNSQRRHAAKVVTDAQPEAARFIVFADTKAIAAALSSPGVAGRGEVAP